MDCLFEKTKNKRKRGRGWPIFENFLTERPMLNCHHRTLQTATMRSMFIQMELVHTWIDRILKKRAWERQLKIWLENIRGWAWISVTRWLDNFTIIVLLRKWKFAQFHTKFAKVCSIFSSTKWKLKNLPLTL